MLCLVRQVEERPVALASVWNLKKSRIQRVDWWLAGAGRWGNGAIPGQKIHTSSCKTITLWGSNARHGSYS